jgi:hypothetical protein
VCAVVSREQFHRQRVACPALCACARAANEERRARASVMSIAGILHGDETCVVRDRRSNRAVVRFASKVEGIWST